MRKTIIILLLALAVVSFAKVAEPFEAQEEISNSFIKAVCGNDGKFTIGTSDGRRLLYDFPSAGSTSHTNIRVDGDTLGYGNWNSWGPSGTITEALHINGGALEMTFTYADVDVTQRLSIVSGPTTGNHDTILIEYLMHNRASTARSVGVVLEMDTQICTNDRAPISTSFGYVAVEQDFTAPSIPQYWQAFQTSPTQAESLLVGQGTLIGSGAVMPNRFCLGPWGTYDDVRWNYTSTGNPYGDSAVLLWWNPVSIPAGGTHRVATLYGIGAGSVAVGDLALNITAPLSLDYDSTTGGYTPNPFTVNALITNTTTSTVDGVTATINLPAGLSLASGETATKTVSPSSLGSSETGSASWSVVAEHRTDAATLEYSVSTSGGGYTNSMNRTIDIPAGTTEGVNITVTRVDAEGFPVIHAYCIVTDDSRNPIIGLDERHFVVHEDGVFESPITVEMMATSVLGGQADIAVVFDVTGSMGSYINAMKDNVINFANNLATSGLDYRLGLVTFLDEIGQVFDFTADVDEFRGWVSGLRASGGGDTPENALEGIARAMELGFRPSAQRIIIMITDAPYHQANSRTDYTTDSMIDMINGAGAMCVVIGHDNEDQHRLAEETGGFWYPIGSDFDVLLDDLSGILTAQYIVTYTTHNPIPEGGWRNVHVTVNTGDFEDSDDGRYYVGSTMIYFEPETTWTTNGLGFRLDLCAASISDLNDFHAEITWNNALLVLDSIKAGELLARGAEAPLEIFTIGSGLADISLTRSGSMEGVSGSGVIAKLYYRVIAPITTTEVRMQNVVARNPGGVDLGAAVREWAYIRDIYHDGGGTGDCMLCDFDCDGDIDTRDFVLLGGYWQPANSSEGDVGPATGTAPMLTPVPDAAVNYEDLFIFGRMWNWYHMIAVGRPRIGPQYGEIAFGGNDGSLEILGRGLPPFGMSHIVVEFDPTRTTIHASHLGDLENGFISQFASAIDFAAISLAGTGGSAEISGDAVLARIEFSGENTFVVREVDLRDGRGEKAFFQSNINPLRFALAPAMPNPFNPVTTIGVELPSEGALTVEVFDVSGRKVATVHSGELQAGPHSFKWNGNSEPSGIYFIKASFDGESVVQRAILMK